MTILPGHRVRPEHIEITAPRAGRPSATTVDRTYYGHDLTDRVRAGGSEFLVRTHYRVELEVGSEVSLGAREPARLLEEGE